MEKVMEFIKAQQAAEKAGENEFICPLCGGKARWGRSTYNGHIYCICEGCGFKILE